MTNTILRLSALPLLAAAALPSAGFAQGISGGTTAENSSVGGRELMFEGSVAPACVIRAPTPISQTNGQVTIGPSGNVDVALQDGFLDPASGVPNAVEIAIAFPITCNTAHNIHVESRNGGLVNQAATGSPGPFRARLDFSVEMRWAGGTTRFDTASARQLDAALGNAATGNADIRIAIPGGGTPLVAGIYADTITIQVQATS